MRQQGHFFHLHCLRRVEGLPKFHTEQQDVGRWVLNSSDDDHCHYDDDDHAHDHDDGADDNVFDSAVLAFAPAVVGHGCDAVHFSVRGVP